MREKGDFMYNIDRVTGLDSVVVKVTWRSCNSKTYSNSLYVVHLNNKESNLVYHGLFSNDISYSNWVRHRNNICCSKIKKFFRKYNKEIFVSAEVIDFI